MLLCINTFITQGEEAGASPFGRKSSGFYSCSSDLTVFRHDGGRHPERRANNL